jgi:hypothetical protein
MTVVEKSLEGRETYTSQNTFDRPSARYPIEVVRRVIG